MKDFYAFHVVTERPMKLNQIICFNKGDHSGVYHRVASQLDRVNEIYEDPKKYVSIDLEHHTQVALRELALEEVRTLHFPEFPSRMNCLYVSNTIKEAENWYNYFISIGRPTYQIVQLYIKGNIFEGDATKCFTGTTNRETNLELARKYWESPLLSEREGSVKEVLVDGTMQVIKIWRANDDIL